jgi:hypothetical protein
MCSDCGEVLVAQEIVPLKGHIESDWIIDVNSTETSEGLKHIECTRCSEVLKRGTITQNVIYLSATKTGTVSTSPGITYSAAIEYRNRTEDSVEIRIKWTSTIKAYSWTVYGQNFNFTIGSAKSGNVRVASFNAWKTQTSSKRSQTGTSGWVKIPLSTLNATTVDLKVYYWQTNSNNVDMYKYDGTEAVQKTWTINIPEFKSTED